MEFWRREEGVEKAAEAKIVLYRETEIDHQIEMLGILFALFDVSSRSVI